ncbi:MAG: site-2 protease family protein [Deltaproteobacteria bacterium]|nr:site-2 protease family protein [Deltaproteobacteria bacterium]
METETLLSKLIIVILFMPGFLFSLSCHEAAHAYAAFKRGDPTAKNLGRVTLNPIPHTDILGTLILPIMGIFTGFFFGWGKPVPVDYRNLKNYKRDALWISAAGPLSNFLLALVFSGLVHLYVFFLDAIINMTSITAAGLFFWALKSYVYLNLALCFFNLIPIQPLDGSKILFGILPDDTAHKIDAISRRYGMVILIVLIMTGAFKYILWPPVDFIAGILVGG